MRRGDAELGRIDAGVEQSKNAMIGVGSRDFQLRFHAFPALFDDAGGSGEEVGWRSYVRVFSSVEEVVEKRGFDGAIVKKKWVSG